MEPVIEFLRNSSLLDLLVLVVTVILVLAGILILIVGRSRRLVYGFLVAAVVPLLLGFLSMYLKRRALGQGWFADPSLEAIEAGRREALIIAVVGATGSIVLVLMGLLGLVWKRGGKT